MKTELGPLDLIEKIRRERGVVVVKWDGERDGSSEEPTCTVLISGGPLGGDAPIRRESNDVSEALQSALGEYARRFWR